jgi:immediate early response 3-interacting protein 1
MVNSVMILNRRRFLAKYGLDDLNHIVGGGMAASSTGDSNPLRTQAVGLLHAVQYLKVPVIACNIVMIIFELLLGGA